VHFVCIYLGDSGTSVSLAAHAIWCTPSKIIGGTPFSRVPLQYTTGFARCVRENIEVCSVAIHTVLYKLSFIIILKN